MKTEQKTMRVTIRQADLRKVREKIKEYQSLGWTLLSFEQKHPLADAEMVFALDIDDIKPPLEAKAG